MSLPDAVRDLKKVTKTLDAAKFNFEPIALKNFLDGIKIEKPAMPPENTLKKLLEKFLRGEENFSAREIRDLPFIIHEPEITSSDTIEILQKMNFSRASHLRRILSVYLSGYDGTDKTEILRQVLNRTREIDSVSLRKIFAARELLFGERRFTNMKNLFTEKLSVRNALETIGLSDFYRSSKFIQTALKNFFRMYTPLNAQLKILEELNADFDVYESIFPAVADSLIQTAERFSRGKKECMEIFYGRLGDPRFGDSRFKWNGVSQRSREIFCHWLSAEDLVNFFEKILKTTTKNTTWLYRKKFWNAYLPHIINTKIFLGNDARQMVASWKERVNLNHGALTGAAANQSVFVFQIGKYIFSEWSHDGSLRVHRAETQVNLFDFEENLFECNSISRDVLIGNFVYEQGHHSPKTYFWQKKVNDWIGETCGIYTDEKDWRLED